MMGEGPLAECAMAYGAAVAQARGDASDIGLAEACVAARLALFDCLLEAGWAAPPEAVAQARRDRALLAEPQGAMPE